MATKFDKAMEELKTGLGTIEKQLKSKPPKPGKDANDDLKLLREQNENRFTAIDDALAPIKEMFTKIETKAKEANTDAVKGPLYRFFFDMF